jgi:ABC-2 type transport system ATP-binding protein
MDLPPELEGYPCELTDETTLEVEIHRNQGINRLFDELKKHDIQVNGMRNKANRLEELFLDLVESGVDK